LPEQTRRHWTCSLRQIAKWLDRPAEVIPARWQSVRISVSQLHHARLGMTAKTLANHRSNIRAALRWFGREHDVPQRGVRLSPDWVRFCDGLEKRIRDRLYSLVRYCSARRIGPAEVDDKIFDEYWRYRTETTARASNNTAKRFMIRAWDACAAVIDGWPLRRLTEPPIKKAEPAWDDLPEGLCRYARNSRFTSKEHCRPGRNACAIPDLRSRPLHRRRRKSLLLHHRRLHDLGHLPLQGGLSGIAADLPRAQLSA
jgi:hypothetical protein